jgi:hypothetical protein
MENYHLTKSGDHWQLLKEGAARASFTAPTKKEASDKAHAFLEEKVASLKIHGEDGGVQEERTYPRAKDPRKSLG